MNEFLNSETDMTNKRSFLACTQSVKLSPREQAICDYIASHSNEIIHMSITETAEQCQTSEATLVRLSKKLGYKGFQALKISVAQDTIDPVKQFHESLSKDDSIPVIAHKIFYSYTQVLGATLNVLDFQHLETAADYISKAEKVVFLAAGGSRNVADDAVNKLLRIGIAAYSYTDNNMQRMLLSILTEKDVAIAISHSGATLSTIEALALAHDTGAKCITITNWGKSPILKYSDVSLFTSSSETFYKSEALSSRIAQLTVIDTLITILSFRNEAHYYENLQKTRKALGDTKF